MVGKLRDCKGCRQKGFNLCFRLSVATELIACPDFLRHGTQVRENFSQSLYSSITQDAWRKRN